MYIFFSFLFIGFLTFHIINLFLAYSSSRRIVKEKKASLENTDIEIDFQANVVLFIPLYLEQKIISQLLKHLTNNIVCIPNVTIILITAEKELKDIVNDKDSISRFKENFENNTYCEEPFLRSTAGMIKDYFIKEEKPKNLIHIFNTSGNHSKAAQLSEALKYCEAKIFQQAHKKYYIGIYDADSLIDPKAIRYIQKHSAKNNNNYPVYQQVPFYPVSEKRQKNIGLVALSRAIYNLNYCLTHELPYYWNSIDCYRSGRQFYKGCHLIGHGYYIQYKTLIRAGGFKEPSCDSSLGFALAYNGIPICPIPILDISSTPMTLSATLSQGVVWFNGIELYRREFRKNTNPDYLRNLIILCRFGLNNLYWGLMPVLIFFTCFIVALNNIKIGILGLLGFISIHFMALQANEWVNFCIFISLVAYK